MWVYFSNPFFWMNNFNNEGGKVLSHKSKNMVDQVINELKSMAAFGESRHKGKMEKITQDKIYSFNTFEAYKKHCCDFAKYCQKELKCKNLSSSRQFVDDYLKMKIDKGYSPYTIKLISCSLGKLFHEPTTNFIETPARHRDMITRSRQPRAIDRFFSITKNKELINFCEHTGLRRRELENLKGDCLTKIENNYYVKVENGKGGKFRLAPILENNKAVIEKIQKTPNNSRVWGKVHGACDVHGYRSNYANCLYRQYARPLDSIPKEERYHCRRDLRGETLDKAAMAIVSKALGHNRIQIFAYSYFRK